MPTSSAANSAALGRPAAEAASAATTVAATMPAQRVSKPQSLAG